MNVHETTEIRELTTAEMDEVNGGSIIVNAIRAAWNHAHDTVLINTNWDEIQMDPECARSTGC